MELIKVVEDNCEYAYSACESINEVVGRNRAINDILEDFYRPDYSKSQQSTFDRLYDESLGIEIEFDNLQKKAVELLKRQNKMLERLERQAEAVKTLDVSL